MPMERVCVCPYTARHWGDGGPPGGSMTNAVPADTRYVEGGSHAAG